MLSFGGGLGTMPAFAADYFGPKHLGPIVGLLMTAQGCGAIVGPLVQAHALEATGSYGPALSTIALILAISTALPLALRPPGRSEAARLPVPAASPLTR
jgi:OFA family oxalate/formate antiporter-like MFS transporter